ncbi:MAG TPA: potassium channel family protein [Rhodanobacteraceae bacterium]|nr:potassium channel family protein [Rhodanobacteraceae bacterium]
MSDASAPTERFVRVRWLIRVYRHPSALLLLVQLAGLLLYPFLEGSAAGSLAFGAVGVVVLVVTIGMVHRTRGHVRVGIAVAVAVVALNTLQALTKNAALVPWAAALEALFYFYAAGSLIRYMLGDRRATTDEIVCSAATFTLLAWAFTYLFLAWQAVQPGCFAAAVDSAAPRTWSELAYLSFALLSSTGIGDVIPLTPHARSLAALEMFVGLMYLTLVVSRLIGLTLLRRSE